MDQESGVIEKKSFKLRMKKEPKPTKPKASQTVVVDQKEEIKEDDVPLKSEVSKKVVKPRKKKGQPVILSSDDSDVQEELSKMQSKPKSPTDKKNNNWLDHVKQFRVDHPEITYKDCLKAAKDTYKKA